MASFEYRDVRVLQQKSMRASSSFGNKLYDDVNSYLVETAAGISGEELIDLLSPQMVRKYYNRELFGRPLYFPDENIGEIRFDVSQLFKGRGIGLLKVVGPTPKILWIVFDMVPEEYRSDYVDIKFLGTWVSEIIEGEFLFHSESNYVKSPEIGFLCAAFKGIKYMACYVDGHAADFYIPVL